MKHQVLKWNPVLEEWFCAKCAQTSDHFRAEDAEEELEQFLPPRSLTFITASTGRAAITLRYPRLLPHPEPIHKRAC
jgi:hypothetical protein